MFELTRFRRRTGSPLRRKRCVWGWRVRMYARHHVTFWLVTLLALAGLLWLLSDVLLPFVAGLALAYLQAPLADRLERIGMNRTIAALLIVTCIVLALVAVVVLIIPLLVQQGSAFVASIPGHFK